MNTTPEPTLKELPQKSAAVEALEKLATQLAWFEKILYTMQGGLLH